MHLNAFIRHASIGAHGQPRPARQRHRPDDRRRRTACCSSRPSTRSSCYARTCGDVALDVELERRHLQRGRPHRRPLPGRLRVARRASARAISVYVVNRDPDGPREVEVGSRRRPTSAPRSRSTPSPGRTPPRVNSWDDPDRVVTTTTPGLDWVRLHVHAHAAGPVRHRARLHLVTRKGGSTLETHQSARWSGRGSRSGTDDRLDP